MLEDVRMFVGGKMFTNASSKVSIDLGNSNSNSKFIKSPASGSSDLIYNNWKSNKTTSCSPIRLTQDSVEFRF